MAQRFAKTRHRKFIPAQQLVPGQKIGDAILCSRYVHHLNVDVPNGGHGPRRKWTLVHVPSELQRLVVSLNS